MYPDEILQMENAETRLLVRVQKTIKCQKIIPDEIAGYNQLEPTRITDYIPEWRQKEMENKEKNMLFQSVNQHSRSRKKRSRT